MNTNKNIAVEITPPPVTAPAFGLWTATIMQAYEGRTQRGDDKYVLTLEINDAGAVGHVVRCHLSLADYYFAVELVLQFKKALGVAERDPLPALRDLIGKQVRILVTPWELPTGEILESVSGFEPVVNSATTK